MHLSIMNNVYVNQSNTTISRIPGLLISDLLFKINQLWVVIKERIWFSILDLISTFPVAEPNKNYLFPQQFIAVILWLKTLFHLKLVVARNLFLLLVANTDILLSKIIQIQRTGGHRNPLNLQFRDPHGESSSLSQIY